MSELKDKIILSNVQKYKIDNMDCENLCLKAMKYGIKKVLVGPSSVPLVKKMLRGSGVEIGVTISYPSSAYFPDAKAEEAIEQVKLHPEIAAFYVVMAVGRYLSGYKDEIHEEMKQMKRAAQGREVYFILESTVLNEAQLREIGEMAVENGIAGLVDTTGFKPYDIPFPSDMDREKMLKAAEGKHKVITSGFIDTREEMEQAASLDVDGVIVTNADYLAG